MLLRRGLLALSLAHEEEISWAVFRADLAARVAAARVAREQEEARAEDENIF